MNSHYFQQATYNHNNYNISTLGHLYLQERGGVLCVMTSRLQCKEKQLAQSFKVVFPHCCITHDDF